MPNCYWARCGLETMEQEFGADRILWVEEHIAGGLTSPDVQERAVWYGVPSAPYVRIDGNRSVGGVGGCDHAAELYRAEILERLDETEGMSPVEVQGTFTLGSSIVIGASFTLLDPVSLSDLQATFFVVEDSVLYEGEIWPRVVRDMYLKPITLTQPGDAAIVHAEIPLDPAWSADRLYVLAFLQQLNGGKPVIQGARFDVAAPWAGFASHVRSVPEGNGAAVFQGILWNDRATADTMTIDLGDPFDSWWVDVQVGDDPAWHVPPAEIVLDPQDSVAFQLRVHTDGVVERRAGTASIASQLALTLQHFDLEVFNGTWSILLVDDDLTRLDEIPIQQGILDAGLLHDSWDVARSPSGAPSADEMRGYDVVLWQTGLPLASPVLTTGDMESLEDYLDHGGSLFLTSHQYLNDGDLDPEFTSGTLGVAEKRLDLGYAHMDGLAGDPIGDGLDIDLSLSPPLNRSDGAVPGPTATTFLFSSAGDPAGLRNERPGGSRALFLPWALHGLRAEEDPDNIATMIRRGVEWLVRRSPAGTGESEAFLGASRFLGVRPNPARGRVEIEFHLSGRDAQFPVSLEVFDLAGRRVRLVFEELLPPGRHVRGWDPAAETTAYPTRSGLYFLRLDTRSGFTSTKLVLLPPG